MGNCLTKCNRYVPIGLVLVVAFVFLLTFSLYVSAEVASDQAVVEFDGDVVGDDDGSFLVTGNVRFMYDGMEIRSDSMLLEPGGEVAHFTGNVEVETEDQVIYGDRFIHNISADTSVLFEPSGTLELESVKGPVYYRGETMSVLEDRILLTGAMFTTCSCETPGYYLAGSRMEIIPGHVMIIHNVRFVESGITLFYWPRLTIPITESARPPFQLPQVGYNASDGWFVRVSLPYGRSGAGGGFVHLDWMQLKGYGAGLTHYYKDDASGHGRFRLYAVANNQTGTFDPQLAWIGRVETERWNTSWDLGFDEDGWIEARRRSSDGNFSIHNRRPDGQVTLNGSFTRTATPSSATTRFTGNFRMNQQLPGNTRLALTGDARVWDGTSADRRLLGYRVDLGKSSGPITWSLITEESFNQDLDKEKPEPTVPWRTLSRHPEIVVGTRPNLRLLGRNFPLTFELGYGQYTERRSAQTIINGTRSTALAQLRTTTIPLGSKLSLSFGGYARGYLYGEGSERLVLSSTVSTTYRPTSGLSLRTSYDYLDNVGEGPFRFDRTAPRERVRSSLQYGAGPLNFTLSGGYSLLDQYAEDVTLSLHATPLEATSVRFQSAYSLRYGHAKYAAGTLEIGDGKPFSVQVGGKYSFEDQGFERIDGALKLSLGAWDLQYEAIYDATKEEFTRGLMTLLRDLDCRQIGFSYDQTRGEIWFEYRITAIPALGVRLGSNEERLMFDLEGWQELVSQ